MRKNFLILYAIILSISMISCSNSVTPIIPQESTVNSDASFSQPSLSESNTNGLYNSARGVFGAWKVSVDISSLTAEIIPARSAQAIGDIFDSDLSQFLTVSPCANCLIIPRLMIDGYGNLLMEVGMKHPFKNIATRPDLHGFDVRAIFISNSPLYSTLSDIKVLKPDNTLSDAIFNCPGYGFLNADGYTNDYDWLPTDTRYFITGTDINGTLNPFLRYFEDYNAGSFDPHAPAGHNVMPVGAGYYSRIAVFSESALNQTNPFEFYIVADVAYGQSAVLANRTNPKYFLPAFHRTEPWRVEYWIENNNLDPSDPNSTADLVVQVFDWQHSATVDPQYPNPSNLSGIPESSKVLKLELSVPRLQNNPIIITTPEAGTGSPSDPLRFRFTVTNENLASVNVTGLLAVRDELHGHASPSGRKPIPPLPAGFPYETLDLLDYSYYLPVEINFPKPSYPSPYWNNIKGELFYSYQNAFAKYQKTIIKPNFFMDRGHRKFQYRWDFNYDGTTFDIDGGGLPSPEITFPKGGRYNVGLKVRTNSVPPREYIYSIPVFSHGEAFLETLPPASTQSKTSPTLGHSAYIDKKGTSYIVYTDETSGVRNIKLAIIDKRGWITIRDVTDDANVEAYPSLTVIEEGAGAGIYVAYARVIGSNAFIYADKADLNGVGFAGPNMRKVTSLATGTEIYPIICYYESALHIYYMETALFVSRIKGAHSIDYNVSWIEDGLIVDNGSLFQYFPSYAHDVYMYLVWQDAKDYTENGSDIYLAESSDGITFTNIKNISTKMGKVWDIYPSATCYYQQVAIAYQSYLDGSDERDLCVMFYNPGSRTLIDILFWDSDGIDEITTRPVIGCGSMGRFIIGYGIFSKPHNHLSVRVEEIVLEKQAGDHHVNFLITKNYSPVDQVAAEDMSPVIFSHSPQPYACESFIAWTDYSSGSRATATTPTEYLGNIKTSVHITENNDLD